MSPEATSTAARGYFDVPFTVNQGTWTMPATNKLLFEAGVQSYITEPIFGQPPPDGITNLIPVTEQSNANRCAVAAGQPLPVPCTSASDNIPWAPVANYRYRAVESWGPAESSAYDVLGSTSYVTGAHSAKIGYQLRYLDLLDKDVANSTQLGYRVNRGIPNAVSYYLPDFGRRGDHHQQQRLRAGQLDARTADAAGRAALGPRQQLRASREERHARTRRS